MDSAIRMLLPLTMLLLSACSSDSAQRFAFDILQEAGKEACQKDKTRTVACGRGDSYDVYQRNRAVPDQAAR